MMRAVPPSFTVDWFSHSVPVWEPLLAPFAGRPGLRFLEIGSWEGRSACWLLEHVLTHPSSCLICIDTFAGNRSQRERGDSALADIEDRFDANIRAVGGEDRVRKLKGRSEDILGMLPSGSQHFIYIDGSHDASDVLTDAVLSWRLIEPGGIVVFDDYEWNYFEDPLQCPKAGVDAFLAVFGPDVEVLSRGWQVVVRKRLSAPSAA